MSKPRITWHPQPHQLFIGEVNESYLHSLWVGFTAPFLNLPLMFWQTVLKPLIFGLMFLPQYFLICFIAGLRGRATGVLVEMPTIVVSVVTSVSPPNKDDTL